MNVNTPRVPCKYWYIFSILPSFYFLLANYSNIKITSPRKRCVLPDFMEIKILSDKRRDGNVGNLVAV